MIYLYKCDTCQDNIEIIKSMKDSSREEHCEKCSAQLRRIYSSPQLVGTRVGEPYFNNGLGCWVRGAAHAKQIAKERGLVEVGNERPEKHLKPRYQELE